MFVLVLIGRWRRAAERFLALPGLYIDIIPTYKVQRLAN